MAENSPELANLRDLPSKPRLDPGSTKADFSTTARPKKPFLKRGVGTQARITATQRKKYVPKGGFVLTLEEEQGIGEEPPEKDTDRQTQSTSIPAPQESNLQPLQASKVQQPGLLAAAAPATDTIAPDSPRTHKNASRAARSVGSFRGAADDSASTDAIQHSSQLNPWAQPESLLDPEGDTKEMHSQTEMLLGSVSTALGNTMAGALPRFPAPPGTNPNQAQEVSNSRAHAACDGSGRRATSCSLIFHNSTVSGSCGSPGSPAVVVSLATAGV